MSKNRKLWRGCAIGVVVGLCGVAPISLADDFGVGSNADRINSLLQDVQTQPAAATPAPAPAPAAAAPAAAASTAAAPAANDPVGDSAFATMVRNVLPLTPEQIKTLHYLFNQSQQASAQYPGIPPKPTSTSLIVNLAPGAAPPVIRLQQGFVTSLVFVDATGAPWPIKAFDLGNQNDFNVQWDQKGNTLMVQALSRYNSGNIGVLLQGLDTPIMITLLPGQTAVDYRADLRIPKLGPNPNPVLGGLPATEDPQLIGVLDGIPPDGARALVVQGAGEDCQAWLYNNNLYVRTPMTILSPAFISTMSSADGTHAYQLQPAPVVLALSRGKTVKLTIEGL